MTSLAGMSEYLIVRARQRMEHTKYVTNTATTSSLSFTLGVSFKDILLLPTRASYSYSLLEHLLLPTRASPYSGIHRTRSLLYSEIELRASFAL